MKVHRFISSAAALETFGFDYIGHFKCGSCRYVVRLAGGTDGYLVCKEYSASGRAFSVQVDDPFHADSRAGAIEKAGQLVRKARAGVNCLVTVISEEPLN